MATYSNQEIQTLTQQATTTPQFSGPKTNVLSGIADIASVGLQAYGKSKAREELAAARVQQEAEAEQIASESNRRADFVRELTSNPKATPRMINDRLTTYDREALGRLGGSHLKMSEVRKDMTSLTGLTEGGVMTSSQKEAVRLEKQKKAEQEAEEAQILTSMANSVATGTDLTREEAANLSRDEIIQLQADATRLEEEQKEKARDFANAEAQFRQDRNNLAEVTETFVSATFPAEVNNLNVALQQALAKVPLDASGGVDTEAVFSVLGGFETQIPTTVAEIVQRGANLEKPVRVPPEASAALAKQLQDTVKVYRDEFSQTGVLSAMKNKVDKQVFGTILSASADPKSRTSAVQLMVQIAAGVEVNIEDSGKIIRDVVTSSEGQANLTGTLDENRNTVSSIITFPKGADGLTFTPEQKANNAAVFQGLLDQNSRGELAFIKARGLQDIVAALTAPSYASSFEEKDRVEIGQSVIDMSQKYEAQAAASVAAAVNSSMSISVPKTGIQRAGGSGVTQDTISTLTDFSLNPETLQLEPIGPVLLTQPIRDYNKFNADRLKLVESNGGDVDAFKNDVVRATATAFATKGDEASPDGARFRDEAGNTFVLKDGEYVYDGN